MAMISIGVDPGKSGCITFLENEDDSMTKFKATCFDYGEKWTNIESFISYSSLIDEREIIGITVEKVHSMPGQGVVSTATFAKWTGISIGLLIGVFARQPLEVDPKRWWNSVVKKLGVPLDSTTKKEAAIELAKRITNNHKAILTKKKHHNRADSILIAYYNFLIRV